MALRVLGIDTAGPMVGAACWEGTDASRSGQFLGSWSARVVRGAEQRLVPALTELLQGRQVNCIAVAVGPGAFTGLRVGVATALGLATAWDLPLVGVSSLQARALLAWGHPRVLALLDARKGRFYAGCYDTRGAEPVLVTAEQDAYLQDVLPPLPALAVGEGAQVAQTLLAEAGICVAPLADDSPARAVSLLGARCFLRGEAVAATALRIRYLRKPDARIPADMVPSG